MGFDIVCKTYQCKSGSNDGKNTFCRLAKVILESPGNSSVRHVLNCFDERTFASAELRIQIVGQRVCIALAMLALL